MLDMKNKVSSEHTLESIHQPFKLKTEFNSGLPAICFSWGIGALTTTTLACGLEVIDL